MKVRRERSRSLLMKTSLVSIYCCCVVLVFGIIAEGGKCLECVEQNKGFCQGTSKRIGLANVLTLNKKRDATKTEQCRGTAYVAMHECDTNWCGEKWCCPEYSATQTASVSAQLAQAEKTKWTQAEAQAATLRILKSAFIGVMVASSVGAVSVGLPCRFNTKRGRIFSLPLSLSRRDARTNEP